MTRKSQGGIYERAPGVWLVKVSGGPDPKRPGRYRQVTEIVKGTKNQAKIRRGELLKEVEQGNTFDGNHLTLRSWLEEWLRTGGSESEVSAKTSERYGQLMQHVLRDPIASTRLRKLSAVQVAAFHTRLRESGKLSERSIHHVHVVMLTALNEAVRLGFVDHAKVSRFKAPKVNASKVLGDGKGNGEKPKVLTVEEFNKLIEHANRFDLREMIALGFASGIRLGEALGLRWDDIGHNSGALRIERSVEFTGKYGARFKETKTKNSKRTIGLDSGTVGMLRRRQARLAKEAEDLGSPLPDGALLFPRSIIEPTTPRGIPDVGKQFKTIAKAAGLAHFSFHSLRHSHGSHLLDRNIPLPAVSARLGHSSVAVTARLYSHEIRKAEDRSAEVMGGLISATMGTI